MQKIIQVLGIVWAIITFIAVAAFFVGGRMAKMGNDEDSSSKGTVASKNTEHLGVTISRASRKSTAE